MKKLSLIFIILILLISCSKMQEKKRIEINNSNRFRMTKFRPEDIPQFKSLYSEGHRYEKKDNKIRYGLYSCEDAGEGADGVVYYEE